MERIVHVVISSCIPDAFPGVIECIPGEVQCRVPKSLTDRHSLIYTISLAPTQPLHIAY
jgi:hypothetical protein